MMQRILNSKNLLAFVLAATGMTLYFRVPFPEGNIFLRVTAVRSPSAFEILKYSYTLFLFSTPYIGYSVLFSGLYIFGLRAKQRIRAGKLPLFPDPRKRDDLFLVFGEVHNPRKQLPAENPQWLVIPERDLLTGVAILGAIGSGKTSCCMYPFAEQILAYRARDTERRIGGLVLEVKGDFCHRPRCGTDYRASDKHDPAYYARHTVEKARAALNSNRRDVQSPPEASGDSAPVRE